MRNIAIRRYGLPVPKIVDHVKRRQHIARAHQREVAEHGFSATTYARVAAAADLSVGTIQHYFVDRAELVRFSFDDLLTTRDDRVTVVVEAGEDSRRPIRAIVVEALHELLPLDETRRREHSVGQQLRAEAWREPALRDLAVQADARLHERLRVAVENGTVCGEVEPDTDPHLSATRILATAQGLADQLALSSDPASSADDVLGPVVRTVFTGRCHRYPESDE